LADEIITTHGIVTEKRSVEAGCRIKVDVWCDNEQGEKKTVGWVEVTLPN